MAVPDLPPTDQLIASAIQFLIDGGEENAAKVLLACSDYEASYTRSAGTPDLVLTLVAPRALYHFLSNSLSYLYDPFLQPANSEEQEASDIASSIQHALTAVLPSDIYLKAIDVRYGLITINPQWHDEFLAALSGTGINNQGVVIFKERPLYTWNNLRFRSQTEIRVAEALERKKVLFFPNCITRLGFRERQNREPDFLVCHEGKWGILEIDGEPFHPPTRTTEDHEYNRLFQAHGILLIQHFDAAECWENADGVIEKFLYLLKKQVPPQLTVVSGAWFEKSGSLGHPSGRDLLGRARTRPGEANDEPADPMLPPSGLPSQRPGGAGEHSRA